MAPVHIIGHAPLAWGHTKPLLIFMARLAELRPASVVVVTLFTSQPILPKVQHELGLISKKIAERINIIDVGPPTNMFGPQLGVNSTFKDIWDGQKVTILRLNSFTHETLPKPTVMVLDPMRGFARSHIKDISSGACSVVAWIAATMAGTLYLVGPEHLGDLGDLAVKIDTAAKENGKTPMKVANSVLKSYDGKVVQIPGLPPMYDCDFFLQEENFPIPAAIIAKDWHTTLISCDGMIAVTISAFEADTIAATREWLDGISVPFFTVGPLEDAPATPDEAAYNSLTTQRSDEDNAILAFWIIWKRHLELKA